MSNINKLKKILIFIVILTIVGLAVFLIVKKYDNKEKQEETQENSNDETIKNDNYIYHESYENIFEIKTTKQWQQVENKYSLNEHAVMELFNENKNSYLVSVVINKEDTKDDFKIFKNDVFKQKETFYKIKIKEYKDVNVNGYNSQYIEFYNTNSENINTYIRAYAIETKNYYVQILLWTLKSNEEVIKEEFDDMISNFKEK